MAEGDWPQSDGDVLYASEVNDLRVGRKVFTLAGPDTHTGDTNWTDVTSGSFTITNGLNALVTGIFVECDLKGSDGVAAGQVNLKITGANIGTVYLAAGFLQELSANTDTRSPRIGTVEAFLVSTVNASPTKMSANSSPALKLLDATTTFQVRFRITNSAQTVTIDDIKIHVVYAEIFADN